MPAKVQVKLVTGANGFIGRAVLAALEERDIPVRAAVRTLGLNHDVAVGDIGPSTNWASAVEGVDTIVHTAASAHVMNESALDPLSVFRKVNVEGTLNLARQAAAASVKQFVFISSIKVNGESTIPGKPFTENDQPSPLDPYSISKWESEVGLRQLAKESGMEVVIIRPPLVYGPGVKANFQRMISWVGSGVPLPLGSIHNKRSLVALENLVSLILTCIENPAAANQIFLVGDDEDLSTTELLQRIASALGKPARLFPFPTCLIIFAASLLGKSRMAQRLLGSLQVDISKARELLDWKPPVSVDEGLRQVADDFKKRSGGL
jgi:nucleoside-diphosphate-sugar epimerase